MVVAGLSAAGERVPDGVEREQGPREHAGRQQREEEPPRLVAAVNPGGEALPVLVDEIEVKEVRVRARRQDVPRRGDGEQQQRAGQRVERPQRFSAVQ